MPRDATHGTYGVTCAYQPQAVLEYGTVWCTTGTTALLIACHQGHEACAQALLQAGADPNSARDDGATALMTACQQGLEACAFALLQAGADPNSSRDNGATALMAACLNGHEACAQALLQAGADPNQ